MEREKYNLQELVSQRMQDKNVKPSPKQAFVFTCLQYKSFENTVGKGEIAHNDQFLFSRKCFLPIWRTLCHFRRFKIAICKLFESV